MNWRSFPKCTPAWLLRHPCLLARWLIASNALRKFGSRRYLPGGSALLLAFLAALFYVSSTTTAAGTREWVVLGLSYWPAIALVAAMHAAMTVQRRLRVYGNAPGHAWLAATSEIICDSPCEGAVCNPADIVAAITLAEFHKQGKGALESAIAAACFAE